MTKVLFAGYFDILHSGHIIAMQLAKCYGDYLVVNIVPDQFAKIRKGEDRPILSERERLFIVKNLKIVDQVICVPALPEDTMYDYHLRVLRAVKPQIWIWSKENPEMRKLCEDHDVMFILIPEVVGIDQMHSTDIINKIKGQ